MNAFHVQFLMILLCVLSKHNGYTQLKDTQYLPEGLLCLTYRLLVLVAGAFTQQEPLIDSVAFSNQFAELCLNRISFTFVPPNGNIDSFAFITKLVQLYKGRPLIAMTYVFYKGSSDTN